MVIFLNADGSCQKITPEHVYQGSNNVNDITVIAPYAQSTALLIGFILPNGLYWESSDGSRYVPMNYVPQSVDGNVGGWHYNLRSSVTELMGDLYVAINAVTAQGNTTSYMCRVIIEESVLPNLPSEPEPDVYDLILKYLGRVQGSLVAVVEKVPGTSNAIRYIDNFGAISSPIVIGGGADVPIPVNAASTIKVPKEAFAAVEGGYSYTVTAGIHGQMRDGAAARDLWVSFDEAEEAAFKGAYEDYTVNEAGDITITVTTPVDLTVRVWNGKGLVDEVARADIAAETERAEAEENRLQEQITELRNTGVDVVARADIAVLKEDLAAEVERAENAEGVLASDIQGLREDITNEAHFRGYLETNAEIEALSGTPNDYAYSAESGTVWIYQTETGWTDSGKTVPDQFTPASTSVPLMDGVGSAGVTEEYARGDHRHPSDTNKLDKSGGTMTGLLKLANDGLRSGNEEYGVQVDRYLNFHALNNANSWGVFNQQNEQVFQVAYQTKKVRVNGELEENGQRVYSPNNPPPGMGGGVTGVKGNAESAYRTGKVNLTPENIGAVNKAGDVVTGHLYLDGGADIKNGNSNTYLELGKVGSTGIEFHCQSDESKWCDFDAYIQANSPNSSSSSGSAALHYNAREHNFNSTVNMGGALNLANATWNLAGDDAYFGDCNDAGAFCIKGANGTTALDLVDKDNDNNMARIEYDGSKINTTKNIYENGQRVYSPNNPPPQSFEYRQLYSTYDFVSGTNTPLTTGYKSLSEAVTNFNMVIVVGGNSDYWYTPAIITTNWTNSILWERYSKMVSSTEMDFVIFNFNSSTTRIQVVSKSSSCVKLAVIGVMKN